MGWGAAFLSPWDVMPHHADGRSPYIRIYSDRKGNTEYTTLEGDALPNDGFGGRVRVQSIRDV